MTILPFPLWPLAEHIEFGQNTFDGSIGSGVLFCISTSCQRPLIFSTPPPRGSTCLHNAERNAFSFFACFLYVLFYTYLGAGSCSLLHIFVRIFVQPQYGLPDMSNC